MDNLSEDNLYNKDSRIKAVRAEDKIVSPDSRAKEILLKTMGKVINLAKDRKKHLIAMVLLDKASNQIQEETSQIKINLVMVEMDSWDNKVNRIRVVRVEDRIISPDNKAKEIHFKLLGKEINLVKSRKKHLIVMVLQAKDNRTTNPKMLGDKTKENKTHNNRIKEDKINRSREDPIKKDRVREDRMEEDRVKDDRVKEDRVREDRVKEDRVKEDRVKQDKIKEDRIRKDKVKEDTVRVETIKHNRIKEGKTNEDKISKGKIRMGKALVMQLRLVSLVHLEDQQLTGSCHHLKKIKMLLMVMELLTQGVSKDKMLLETKLDRTFKAVRLVIEELQTLETVLLHKVFSLV